MCGLIGQRPRATALLRVKWLSVGLGKGRRVRVQEGDIISGNGCGTLGDDVRVPSVHVSDQVHGAIHDRAENDCPRDELRLK